eukprot:TRINITY_DN740_c1_g2_i1.p1 TRINITY_DN740_c1_g2~~TRINITY_DN740_c1_g2_i1.p1  ORF type:complete len:486 (+),score=96.20 TRINITY_DN740_c1_g2_i1:91-1548(+)
MSAAHPLRFPIVSPMNMDFSLRAMPSRHSRRRSSVRSVSRVRKHKRITTLVILLSILQLGLNFGLSYLGTRFSDWWFLASSVVNAMFYSFGLVGAIQRTSSLLAFGAVWDLIWLFCSLVSIFIDVGYGTVRHAGVWPLLGVLVSIIPVTIVHAALSIELRRYIMQRQQAMPELPRSALHVTSPPIFTAQTVPSWATASWLNHPPSNTPPTATAAADTEMLPMYDDSASHTQRDRARRSLWFPAELPDDPTALVPPPPLMMPIVASTSSLNEWNDGASSAGSDSDAMQCEASSPVQQQQQLQQQAGSGQHMAQHSPQLTPSPLLPRLLSTSSQHQLLQQQQQQQQLQQQQHRHLGPRSGVDLVMMSVGSADLVVMSGGGVASSADEDGSGTTMGWLPCTPEPVDDAEESAAEADSLPYADTSGDIARYHHYHPQEMTIEHGGMVCVAVVAQPVVEQQPDLSPRVHMQAVYGQPVSWHPTQTTYSYK